MTTVLDVGAFVLARVGRMDTWKLQKLVYYSQAWHAALFDTPLFDDPIQAWPDGPVAPALWSKHRGKRMVDSVVGADPSSLHNQQALLVDLVCHHYGRLSGAELSLLTHNENPWIDAREGLKAKESSRRPIKVSAMADFYRSRELDGRSVINLISGGLWPTPAPDGDELLERDLAEIRQSFEGSGADKPLADSYSAQFASPPRSASTPRERYALRPSRSE
ncbi:MAG: type II toxin-antitoxin system antitoxin SocA domain-containing protein [Ornithinimicrobium sp.]